MAVESKLSAIVANQLGRMQGALEVQVQDQIRTELNKFTNQCPNTQQLGAIIDNRNNLLNIINLFQNKTSKFSRFSSNLQSIVSTLTTILTILRSIPIPTAVPPGVGVPVALTNRYAELLFDIKRFLQLVEKDIQSINSLVNSVNPFLNTVKDSLNSLDTLIANCTEELNEQERQTLNRLTQPPGEQASAGSPNNNQIQFRSESGIDYTISIETQTDVNLNTPIRRAVAKNNNGIVVLRGESSYSSNTQVLIDELKFRINNQLP